MTIDIVGIMSVCQICAGICLNLLFAGNGKLVWITVATDVTEWNFSFLEKSCHAIPQAYILVI